MPEKRTDRQEAAKPTVSIICAVARNGVIGRDNGMPWRLPDDLRHFKERTAGHPIIMGRRTWESLPGPLPKRDNLVVSRQPGYPARGAQVVPSLAAALAWCREHRPGAGQREVFVIGGTALFAEAWAVARRCYLTEVAAEVAGDTYLRGFERAHWRRLEMRRFAATGGNDYPFRISVLERLWPP